MHTFFSEDISESRAVLTETESKHAIKVLRLNQGDEVRIINGNGVEAFGKISIAHHKTCEIQITGFKKGKKPGKEIIVALVPTKSNDRTEWFLEKATEIGITKFIPVISKNSERKKFNTERWDKITVAAIKQSKRLWRPIVESPIDLEIFLTKTHAELQFIAHCEETNKNELSQLADSTKSQLILIGPEGDFSPDEIELALKNNFIPVSIGNNRLITETAGVVASTLLKFV